MKKWDAPAIAAAIKRRGQTLTGLAVNAGLGPSACRSSLSTPFPAADKAISEFLDVPLHELWPDRYYPDGGRIDRRTIRYREDNKRTVYESHRQNVRAG